MDVHLNPDLQAKINRWVSETGRRPDELVEDAMAGYFDELAQIREMLDSRYDAIKTDKVKLSASETRGKDPETINLSLPLLSRFPEHLQYEAAAGQQSRK